MKPILVYHLMDPLLVAKLSYVTITMFYSIEHPAAKHGAQTNGLLISVNYDSCHIICLHRASEEERKIIQGKKIRGGNLHFWLVKI